MRSERNRDTDALAPLVMGTARSGADTSRGASRGGPRRLLTGEPCFDAGVDEAFLASPAAVEFALGPTES